MVYYFLFIFLSSLTSLIDFFSLLTICLSLPTGVLSSSNQIPSSSFNLKHLSLSLHLKSNPKMKLVVSPAVLNLMQIETPIPSSKQNPEMESSQTKQIFILSSQSNMAGRGSVTKHHLVLHHLSSFSCGGCGGVF